MSLESHSCCLVARPESTDSQNDPRLSRVYEKEKGDVVLLYLVYILRMRCGGDYYYY